MATNVNSGSQIVNFDFRHPTKGKDFNRINRDTIKPGIYKGLTVSFSGNSVFVSSGKSAINCLYGNSDNLLVKIDFQSMYSYGTILPSQFGANEVLYLEYEYGEIVENYAAFRRESITTFLINNNPNAVVIAEITFDGLNQITGIDYSRKTWGSINADADWTVPDQIVYHNTDDYSKRFRIKGDLLPTGVRDLQFQTFNESSGRILTTTVTNTTEIEGITDSTSTTTGALVVRGGIGIVKRLSVGQFDGRVPLGGVIDIPPMFSGANNTGTAEEFPGIPASGVITDDGFMLYEGTIIPPGANPALVGKYTPNVSDDRFLMGAMGVTTNPISTDTGANNGDNTVTLTLNEIPSHNHGGGSHSHTSQLFYHNYTPGTSTGGFRSTEDGDGGAGWPTSGSGDIINSEGGSGSLDIRPKWMKVKRMGRVR
jgi:hypothetical protein